MHCFTGEEESCGLSNPNRSDVQTNLNGRKAFWVWLLAAVAALALLFGIVRWVVGGHG
jgi:hypothetical protein